MKDKSEIDLPIVKVYDDLFLTLGGELLYYYVLKICKRHIVN